MVQLTKKIDGKSIGKLRRCVMDNFFHRIQHNPHIGTTHIALFTAMVQKSGDNWTICFYGKELRQLAKISSTITYFKVLKDLCECHYIEYPKGTSRWNKSTVKIIIYFNKISDDNK